MNTKELPDVIGIGTQRCATSMLHDVLNHHSDIGKPLRGLHFFSEHYQKGEAWYRARLAPYTQKPLLMEFSVSYSYPEHYAQAAKRMREVVPSAGLFIAVRNPVQRAFSDYLRSVRQTEIPKSTRFEDALDQYPTLLNRGLYFQILSTYLKYYDADRILILFYDDLLFQPATYWQSISRFLSVDVSNIPLVDGKVTLPKTVRWPTLNRWIFAAKIASDGLAGKLGRQTAWNRFKDRYRGHYQRVLKMNSEQTVMEAETRQRLVAFYENDIRGLEELSGRDLSHWRAA